MVHSHSLVTGSSCPIVATKCSDYFWFLNPFRSMFFWRSSSSTCGFRITYNHIPTIYEASMLNMHILQYVLKMFCETVPDMESDLLSRPSSEASPFSKHQLCHPKYHDGPDKTGAGLSHQTFHRQIVSCSWTLFSNATCCSPPVKKKKHKTSQNTHFPGPHVWHLPTVADQERGVTSLQFRWLNLCSFQLGDRLVDLTRIVCSRQYDWLSKNRSDEHPMDVSHGSIVLDKYTVRFSMVFCVFLFFLRSANSTGESPCFTLQQPFFVKNAVGTRQLARSASQGTPGLRYKMMEHQLVYVNMFFMFHLIGGLVI